MSYRRTTQTNMTNRAIVAQALKNEGVSYRENGDTFTFTSGPLNRATLDLKTGAVTGDSDFGHTEKVLGSLRCAYSMALDFDKQIKEGAVLESTRQVNGVWKRVFCHA